MPYHQRFLIILVILVVAASPLLARSAAPDGAAIQKAIQSAHSRFAALTVGKNADYIPYLASVPSNLFGIAVATVDGQVYEIGDSSYPFAIESISKIFTLACVLDSVGADALRQKIGVNATGLPFNSVLAIELEGQRAVNPLVNAGAMATVSLVPGANPDERWKRILTTQETFAGRALAVNQEVYRSETDTNDHNRAIAWLLKSYGSMYGDPTVALDLYTRQCSVAITTRDLALMGATLANRGVHPMTGARGVRAENVPRVLSVMATTGLYETTGDWLYAVGLPGKSGVGGGIVAVVPGRMAIAAFSPPLDKSGNSVRAWQAIEAVAADLHLNLFAQR